jgi:hypothetical protein
LTKGVDPLAPATRMSLVTREISRQVVMRQTNQEHQQETMKIRLLLALVGLAIGFVASREVKNI